MMVLSLVFREGRQAYRYGEIKTDQKKRAGTWVCSSRYREAGVDFDGPMAHRFMLLR
ncbi:hypothetical protein JQC72_00215 [Polycladomyces sp. WAk]|uniref:Uncharacterized protein n=1 Tax=Polycladomyces zharkentensis TaxID=2807616 RepID=A0ABS2WEG1_9BACL|nr:hypothetical protein [Polycladomyces sp. WAk]MBN2907944.1 hypothetical protein [Polycladomyces sp. WAk]